MIVQTASRVDVDITNHAFYLSKEEDFVESRRRVLSSDNAQTLKQYFEQLKTRRDNERWCVLF